MNGGVRDQVLEYLALLSSQGAQIEYARAVPIADVPGEIVCMFADDLFQPTSPQFLAAFRDEEVLGLAELYGRLCVASDAFARDGVASIGDALKVPEYRSLMEFAKRLRVRLERDG